MRVAMTTIVNVVTTCYKPTYNWGASPCIFFAQDIHKLLGLLTCLTSEFTLPLVLNVIMTHICFILCMAQSFPSKLHDPI